VSTWNLVVVVLGWVSEEIVNVSGHIRLNRAVLWTATTERRAHHKRRAWTLSRSEERQMSELTFSIGLPGEATETIVHSWLYHPRTPCRSTSAAKVATPTGR
jgi:hypothetical protein